MFLTISNLNTVNKRGIYTDLIRKFRDEGHKVYIVSPIEKKEMKNTHFYKESDITFLRVKTGNVTKNNKIEKGINTLLIEKLFKNAIKKFYNDVKFDLIIYSTPPITFARVIDFVKKRDQAQTYLLLKDIFPQNAIDLKLFKKNGLIHNFFKRKEKMLYQISDHIGCMSEANVQYILKNNKYLSVGKVEVNPNSIEPIKYNKILNYSIYKKYDIPQDRINLIYGGNLGRPQGIEFLVECIKSNSVNPRIHFIIVGSGTHENLIKEYYDSVENNNLTFIQQLPKHEYDDLVSVADVGLIFLDKSFTIPNFPSRLLSYMEVGLPILTATDESTDIGEIVFNNKFGYKSISDNVENFNAILPNFYNKLDREIMGKNAKKYLEQNYTVDTSYSTIMKHFI